MPPLNPEPVPRRGTLSAAPYLFLVVLAAAHSNALGYDLPGYYQKQKPPDLATFARNFPYRDYLASVRFTDFAALQRDRYFLWQKYRDGDLFLFYLGDHFVRAYPLANSSQSLLARTEIGEAYLAPKKGLNRGTAEIYYTIGYFLLGTVAREIETQITHKRFDPTDPASASLIKRLEQNRIYINIEESGRTKLISNLKQGKFGYIASRLMSKLYQERKLFLPVLLALLVISAVFLAFGIRNHIGLLKGLSTLTIIGCLSLLGAVAYAARSAPSGAGSPAQPQPQQLRAAWNLALIEQHFPVGGADHAMQIFRITERGGDHGQAIWLKRRHVRASYLAYKRVPQRFHELQKLHSVLLATTGGFTNKADQPEGFTAEQGTIVNAVLMHDRHGLVMVEPRGGMRVFNLKEPAFRLPDGGPQIDNPLNSLIAYGHLLGWSKTHRATFFQTQLLAFSDRILVNEQKAKAQLRERRILALVSDRQSGAVEHIVFNLPNQQLLARASNEIFRLLSGRGKKVEAILNLDVGGFNILQVYGSHGRLLTCARGTVDLSRATNLIVYCK